MTCLHQFVDGFGGMGDAVTCAKCGLCKYPEALPLLARPFLLTTIREDHPEYDLWFKKAVAARERRGLESKLE